MPLRRFAVLAFCLLCLAPAAPARAHPHMWIDARARLVFDAAGRLAAVRQVWLFDEMSSAYSLQGLVRAADGEYAAKDLQSMADDWVAALGEPQSHYFTWVERRGRTLDFGPPAGARVRWDQAAGRVSLSFELPLKAPASPAGGAFEVRVFDPTYFVAYDFTASGAVALEAAPAGCRAAYLPPQPLDPDSALRLAAVPADAPLPDDLQAIAGKLSHRIEVRCP